MTVDSHKRGSRERHNELKEDAKTTGMKRRMNQEGFDKEMAEIKERLSVMMELLQRSEEERYYGWILRKKKVKWPVLQLRHKQGSII